MADGCDAEIYFTNRRNKRPRRVTEKKSRRGEEKKSGTEKQKNRRGKIKTKVTSKGKNEFSRQSQFEKTVTDFMRTLLLPVRSIHPS